MGYVVSNPNVAYSDFLNDILKFGKKVQTRNSITKRLRNLTVTFETTPLISIRQTAWRNSIREMEWFLSGSSDINNLHPKVKHWWTPWANAIGLIHNNYSKQFRHFQGKHSKIDQIQYLIDTLNKDPFSRRNVITTWNTAEMLNKITPITNCHGTIIQLFVDPNFSVHMTMYQRSCDMIIGVPHNWIQYWAMLMWIVNQTNYKIGSFTWIGGDCHIYQDHWDLAEKVVQEEHEQGYLLSIPELMYASEDSTIFHANDFILSEKYKPLIKEKAKMIV